MARALHGLAALAAIGLTGPWRDGAFGSLLLAPLLAASWTLLGLVQYLLLRRKANALVGLQYFTIFFDAAAFAVFLCDAPTATGFLVPYLPFIAIPVGLRYGVRTFWFAWAGSWLTATPVLYFGHPYWSAQGQTLMSLVFLAVLPAVYFGPLLSQWRVRLKKDTDENQLRALEAAMVAKSAFLARVSHQLRSPLQAIMSSLELMEAPSQQANRPRLAANISISAQRLSQELRDLLTIARAEAWQLHLAPSPFEGGTLLESVAAELEPTADSTGRRILTLPPSEPLFLVADSDKIVQVLANVAKHISATLHPHTLTLSMQPYDEPRGSISFVVEGETEGEPIGTATPLAEDGHKDALNDSLSLTLVRTLAEFLGGHTAQEKLPHSRLRFTVTIPCELVREDEERHMPPGIARIMVVSSNPQACRELVSPLHQQGWMVECVAAIASAANRLALREYALVCVDMDLPRHNARRLALSLKSNQGANRETPILAFHARTSELAGKPWPFDALLAGKISRAGLLETISLLRPERLPR